MRGHLIPELNALQDCFNFNRILLMPANPGRGRKIIGGEYLINGVKLHETIFARILISQCFRLRLVNELIHILLR